ncbi:MAG: FKBP-type peptidyl-prolyl cis-trans isomerase [Planctomycetes bacterium]|nr:FKBP-type peptidyl-prolyl cis-trans isomerase [Planctomycetota bacterium]
MQPKIQWTFAASLITLSGMAWADEPAKPAAQAPTQTAPAAPQGPETTTTRVREPKAPITWSDPEIEKISKLLIGNWKSTAPIPEGADPKEAVEVAMFIAPLRSPDLTDLLYVESSRVDSPQAPYRQAFYQVYRHKNGLRLRTYEPLRQIGGALVGAWTNPDVFPSVSRRDLVATIDLELTPDGDGYSAKSPYPYPTGRLGAVEMTSEATIQPGKIITADKGFDSKGEVLWGAKGDTKFEFTKFEPDIKTMNRDGVWIIEYKRGDALKSAAMGDQITVHYLGFLESGFRFDSSLDRQPPNPLTFAIAEKQVIPGFIQALLGSNVGTVRRVYIPYEQAYGQYGNMRTRIPPYADLYFDFEVMRLQDGAPVAAPIPAMVGGQDPRAIPGLEQVGPDGKPIPKEQPKSPPANPQPAPSNPPAQPK